MNEEYAHGFAQGEAEAWRRRDDPLPMLAPAKNDRERGYNDARLPRTSAWARTRRVSQAWFGDAGHRVVEAA